MARFVETDLSTRVYRVSCGINEAITTAANEPSLGLYRIQEHTVHAVPKLVEDKQSLEEICERTRGASFDLEYNVEVMQSLKEIHQFHNILSSLQRAIEIKQKLNKLEMERQLAVERQRSQDESPNTARRNYGTINPPSLTHSAYSINT